MKFNFSFEFDAPKYKVFGPRQVRRSTITKIDKLNSYDRWFMNFPQNVPWEQLFKSQKARESSISQAQTSQQKKSGISLNKNTNNKNNKGKKQRLPQNTKNFDNRKPQSLQSKHNQIKRNPSKNLPQKPKKNLEKQVQMKKNENVIKKPTTKPINYKVNNQEKNNVSKQNKLQANKAHKDALRIKKGSDVLSLDQRSKKTTLNSSRNVSLPQKVSKGSILNKQIQKVQKPNIKQEKKVLPKAKTLPNLNNIKNDKKSRNRPCLYPIRIQRQWQEKYGKHWYELSQDQLTTAEQSMKKIKQNHKTKQNSKVKNIDNQPKMNKLKKDVKLQPLNKKINEPLHNSKPQQKDLQI